MGIKNINRISTSKFELDKHFKNDNKDSVQSFMATTQNGNVLEGFINLERNERFGQLLIEKVNGRKQPQTIWGIPKIFYPYVGDKEGKIVLPKGKMFFRQKEDGTNISVFPIKENNKIIEIGYKTRRLPLAEMSSAFIDGANLVKFMKEQYPQIEDVVKKTGYTLSFEVFGKNNMHMVSYKEDLAIKLLIALDNNDSGRLVGLSELEKIAEDNQIPIVEHHLVIDEENDSITLTPYFQEKYQYTGFNKRVYKDKGNLYRDVQKIYESINKRDSYANGGEHFTLEGSVIFIEGEDGKNTLWKCKAPSVEEYHMKISRLGTIPDDILDKAVDKTRENLTIHEISDITKAINFMKDELSEEFPSSTIQRNMAKIENSIKKITQAAQTALKIKESGIDLNGEPKEVMPKLKQMMAKENDGYIYHAWQMAKKIN